MTDSLSNFLSNGDLQDYYVNPNTASANGTASLADDLYVRLVSSSSTSLTSLAPFAAAVTGDTWSAVYRFDNLEVRGAARVKADAQVYVVSGDVGHIDPLVFELGGQLDVRALDLGAAGIIRLTFGTSPLLTAQTLIGPTGANHAFDLELNEGAVQVPALRLGTVNATGGALTTTGPLEFTGPRA